MQQGISVTRSVEGNTALMGGIGDNSNTGAGRVFIVPSLQVTPTTDVVAAIKAAKLVAMQSAMRTM